MLCRVRVNPDVRAVINNAERYGNGPYFNIEMEYDEGQWDQYLFIGIEQVAVLHKAMGAILAKHAHA